MTGQERDYEAVLSRVLHTTTDQLEPVGDGLTKIRARLSEPWLKRQWWLLRSEFMVLRWLVVVRCESFFSRIRSRSDVTDLAPDAPAGQEADGGALKSLLSIATSTQAKRPRRSVGPAMAWFRPALAVAGAVVLVVAGVFALGSIRTAVGFDTGSGANGSSNGQPGQNGNPYGGGSRFPGSGTASQGNSKLTSPGASAGHNKPAPSSTPCPAASPPAQNSPTPPPPSPTDSPSPSPTDSPSPSPTDSPSPTISQAPLTGAQPGNTQEAIGTMALVMCEQTPGGGVLQSPSNQAPSGS